MSVGAKHCGSPALQVAELEESTRKKKLEFDTIKATNSYQMWATDLDEFEQVPGSRLVQ